MGRPVMTGLSPATSRLFTHKEHLYLCDRSGEGIAEGIRELRGDPELRMRLATEGRRLFEREFSPDAIGRKFRAVLEDVLAART
jgi:glycosyltransferase involved in cell wall biosynthesis